MMEQTNTEPVILIVEDDAIIALDLKTMLHRFSFRAAGPVVRGEDVIPFLQDHQVDMVLMDILLDGNVDGIEAASMVMNLFDVPVVFTTAQSDDMTIKRASEVSPYGFIVKPYNDREIYGTIRSVLVRHSYEKTVRRGEMRERKANRALRVTSSAGRVILRSDTEDAYLDRLCRAIAEEGGFAGAWIGYASVGVNGGIVPVARSGPVRPGEAADPQKTLTLDIAIDSRTRGVVIICAGEADSFDEDERSLYDGFRSDVEHGIRYFRFKAEKERVEAEMRYLHGFYKNVLEGMSDAILVTHADGTIAYVNTAMDKVSGAGGALAGKKIPDDIPDGIREVLLPLYEKAKFSLSKCETGGVSIPFPAGEAVVSVVFVPRLREARYDGMICVFRSRALRHGGAAL